MSDEIELSETAQEQWDELPPQTRENLLIKFEVAIDEAYALEPDDEEEKAE